MGRCRHQRTTFVPPAITPGYQCIFRELLLVADQGEELLEHQEWLIANALAQAKVLKHGNKVEEQSLNYKSLIGNHPSSTILLDKITPETIGALLAVHEHKVFCEGALWHINSFDQWGVEHGKNIAQAIHAKIVTSRGESRSHFMTHTVSLFENDLYLTA